VLVAGLVAARALATPVFAPPDEPSHVIHAIGVTHGTWLGRTFKPGVGLPTPPFPATESDPVAKAGLAVEAPSAYQGWAHIDCLAFKPDVTANCLRLNPGSGNKLALTSSARYMPAYYLAVGSASWLISPGTHQIYLMRMFSALLSAALVASAVVTVIELGSNPLALTGLAVAVTPMVLFLAGSVNPNALEIAAAIGVWVHGTAIAMGKLPLLGNRVVVRLGIAASALVLARPTSLLWVGLIALVLGISAGLARIRDLLGQRVVRRWAGVVVAAIALQVGWSLWAGAFNVSKTLTGSPVNATTGVFAQTVIGQSYQLVHQMVGVFGWLDTPAPTATLLLWLFGVGALITIAILVAPTLLRALAATLALVIIVPIVAQASYVHTIGYAWQGRYSLPLAVGVPILAGFGASLGRDRIPRLRRVAAIVFIGLAVAQFLAYAQALRRYTVGANGALFFPWSARWNPPIPTVFLLATFAVLIGTATTIAIRIKMVPAVEPQGRSRFQLDDSLTR
jgi:hypothetical protein